MIEVDKKVLEAKVERLVTLNGQLWNILGPNTDGKSKSELLFEIGKLTAQFRITISEVEEILK